MFNILLGGGKMAQLKRFGVFQTAKFAAALYGIASIVFMIPIGLMMAMSDKGSSLALFGGLLFLLMPIVYAVMGFIFVAIVCLLYNFLAGLIGGIEIELE